MFSRKTIRWMSLHAAIAQRGEAFVEEFGGAGVDVEVELEAQAEEDVRGVLVGGDAGIAEGAEEDGVELVAEHFDAPSGRVMFSRRNLSAPQSNSTNSMGRLRLAVAALMRCHGLGRDFLADAVAGDDGDARFGSAVASGMLDTCWLR